MAVSWPIISKPSFLVSILNFRGAKITKAPNAAGAAGAAASVAAQAAQLATQAATAATAAATLAVQNGTKVTEGVGIVPRVPWIQNFVGRYLCSFI